MKCGSYTITSVEFDLDYVGLNGQIGGWHYIAEIEHTCGHSQQHGVTLQRRAGQNKYTSEPESETLAKEYFTINSERPCDECRRQPLAACDQMFTYGIMKPRRDPYP